jgi:hypothetical protein
MLGHPLVHCVLLVLSRIRVAGLADVQAQALGVKVDLIVARLQDAGDVLRVLKFSQVDVGSALLDCITDELSGTSLTLCSNDHGLLLLPCLVHNERRTLRFLLRDLLCLYCCGEFGGEGEVLFRLATVQDV